MTKYKINKGYIIQKIGNKTTIFDSEKSLLYSFNESASFIFNKVKNGQSMNTLINSLSKKFKISLNKAENDVNDFINELSAKKIIK